MVAMVTLSNMRAARIAAYVYLLARGSCAKITSDRASLTCGNVAMAAWCPWRGG
jgi:hypothetical protein